MMLPSMTRVAAIRMDGNVTQQTDAFLRGVNQAWHASGRSDGLWVCITDDTDLTVWAPGEPIKGALP